MSAAVIIRDRGRNNIGSAVGRHKFSGGPTFTVCRYRKLFHFGVNGIPTGVVEVQFNGPDRAKLSFVDGQFDFSIGNGLLFPINSNQFNRSGITGSGDILTGHNTNIGFGFMEYNGGASRNGEVADILDGRFNRYFTASRIQGI